MRESHHIFFLMLIMNNRTPIIYNQNFKYSPEPIIYNGKLCAMKPQGSSINKTGSKYSLAPVIYNRALFKMGATDLINPRHLPCPLNIQLQKTISEQGEIIPKNRLTHNQSWKWQSGTSVNSRVGAKKLMPCYFGKALKQLINWAVAARQLRPNNRILATKLEVKAAFQ